MNDPASILQGLPITREQDDPLWPWLRMLLWINFAVAAGQIVSSVFQMQRIWETIGLATSAGTFWLTPIVLMELLIGLGLPILYLLTTIMCLKRNPPWRMWLIVVCFVNLGMIAFGMAKNLFFGMGIGWDYLAFEFDSLVSRSALPLFTIYFLTRPPIRNLFIPEVRAFEVIR